MRLGNNEYTEIAKEFVKQAKFDGQVDRSFIEMLDEIYFQIEEVEFSFDKRCYIDKSAFIERVEGLAQLMQRMYINDIE